MSAFDYESLRTHIGHKVAVVCYGIDDQDPHNVAVECEDCGAVLLDFDHPEVEEQRQPARLEVATKALAEIEKPPEPKGLKTQAEVEAFAEAAVDENIARSIQGLTIAEVRALLKSIPEEDRCDPDCPGYIVSDAGNGPQIERCDMCCYHTETCKNISDTDVRQLPEAQELLAQELEIEEGSLARSHAIASKADVVLSVSPTLWDDDKIQFARLICELAACNEDLAIGDLCASMDLDEEEVQDLFDRAEKVWEESKKAVVSG